MCVCVCVCVYIYIYIYVNIYIYTHTYIHICVYSSEYSRHIDFISYIPYKFSIPYSTYIYIYIHIHIYTYIYIIYNFNVIIYSIFHIHFIFQIPLYISCWIFQVPFILREKDVPPHIPYTFPYALNVYGIYVYMKLYV